MWRLFLACMCLSGASCRLLEGLYCGSTNCYDILEVTREATKAEIAKSFRSLAKKHHPDKHLDPEAKKAAEEKFKVISTAYDILKDDEARTDYDYMLDNPDQYYAHYYRYYRRRVAPKVDVRVVLFAAISLLSLLKYYTARQRYSMAIEHFASLPRYRKIALEIAKDEGLLPDQRRVKGRSKSELKEELELVVKKIIEEKMDIKGSYAKPNYRDILWVQIIMLPYHAGVYVSWYISWVWRHSIAKQPLSDTEKLYLIRKHMKMGENQFENVEEHKKQKYLDLQLWNKDNFKEWAKEEEEDLKKSLAEIPKYKAYRRYMKNHGPSRMTFDDS